MASKKVIEFTPEVILGILADLEEAVSLLGRQDNALATRIDRILGNLSSRGLQSQGLVVGQDEAILVSCGDETSDLLVTSQVTFRMPFAMNVSDIRASVATAPVGQAIQVDVNVEGSSTFSTVLTIDAGEKTSTTAVTPAVPNNGTDDGVYLPFTDDSEITVDVDQVGSSTAGTGLKVTLIGRRTS